MFSSRKAEANRGKSVNCRASVVLYAPGLDLDFEFEHRRMIVLLNSAVVYQTLFFNVFIHEIDMILYFKNSDTTRGTRKTRKMCDIYCTRTFPGTKEARATAPTCGNNSSITKRHQIIFVALVRGRKERRSIPPATPPRGFEATSWLNRPVSESLSQKPRCVHNSYRRFLKKSIQVSGTDIVLYQRQLMPTGKLRLK